MERALAPPGALHTRRPPLNKPAKLCCYLPTNLLPVAEELAQAIATKFALKSIVGKDFAFKLVGGTGGWRVRLGCLGGGSQVPPQAGEPPCCIICIEINCGKGLCLKICIKINCGTGLCLGPPADHWLGCSACKGYLEHHSRLSKRCEVFQRLLA
eukprot:g7900.t1